MLVTDIRKIDDKRYCLYIDYEPYASVDSSDIRRLHLKIGEDIDDLALAQFRQEYLYKRALNKAINSIKFSDKCEYDIRQKLSDLYYDEEIIDFTLEKLRSYGYVDDLRYAGGYIRRHAAKKGHRVISYELAMKHISQDKIEQAFAEADMPDEMDTIKRILQRRYSVADLKDSRQKVLAYMSGKGFNHRKVAECMRDLISDADE